MAVEARTEDSCLKIELDDQERRTLGRALVERRARLIETTGDTVQPRASQRAGLLELLAIASVCENCGVCPDNETIRSMRVRRGAETVGFLRAPASPRLSRAAEPAAQSISWATRVALQAKRSGQKIGRAAFGATLSGRAYHRPSPGQASRWGERFGLALSSPSDVP